LKLIFAIVTTSILSLLSYQTKAQQVDSMFNQQIGNRRIESKLKVEKLEIKYLNIGKNIDKVNEKLLNKLQKQEEKIKRKLIKKDSLLASKLFSEERKSFLNNSFKSQLFTAPGMGFTPQVYIPKIDTLKTVLKYIEQPNLRIAPLISIDKNEIQRVYNTIENVQHKLNETSSIQNQIRIRKEELNRALNQFGLVNDIKKLNKYIYYYQDQINEYKTILNEPDKIIDKAFSIIKEVPAFKEFMANNSELARYFRIPNSSSDGSNLIQGLQSRSDISLQLQDKIGNGGNSISANDFLQQQTKSATDILKTKINSVGGNDSEMKDFRPNNQKSRRLLNRIEFGINVQSQKSNRLFPTTTDFATSIGYKLNDKSILGIGISYKLGWGDNINNIKITNEGIGLRSFLDIKIKGGIWFSGGYEQNYMKSLEKIPQLNDYSKWQQSGLVGLTKKYKIGKKSGNIQLLWDFLSYQQVPQTKPIKFRIGYIL
jgi:hypothetical protein